jgi:cytochrome c biogenesis protein CcmG/thiol:disulfide interchange protein DsbE
VSTTSEALRAASRRRPVGHQPALLAVVGLCLAVAVRAGVPEKPELTATTLGGDSFTLSALRGHVVLVNFWATWCTPCREEMPALNAFYRRYRERGVDVIGISMDRGRDADEVRQVMRAFNFPAAMLRDISRNDFGAQSELPVTFVIDAQGRLREELRPATTPLTEASLTRIVQPLLPAH